MYPRGWFWGHDTKDEANDFFNLFPASQNDLAAEMIGNMEVVTRLRGRRHPEELKPRRGLRALPASYFQGTVMYIIFTPFRTPTKQFAVLHVAVSDSSNPQNPGIRPKLLPAAWELAQIRLEDGIH